MTRSPGPERAATNQSDGVDRPDYELVLLVAVVIVLLVQMVVVVVVVVLLLLIIITILEMLLVRACARGHQTRIGRLARRGYQQRYGDSSLLIGGHDAISRVSNRLVVLHEQAGLCADNISAQNNTLICTKIKRLLLVTSGP